MVEINSNILLRPFRAYHREDSKHRALPYAKVFCPFRARTLSSLFYDYESSSSCYASLGENTQPTQKTTGTFQVGGQESLSPYQAMGNNPVGNIDPGGTRRMINNFTAVSGAQMWDLMAGVNDELSKNILIGRDPNFDITNGFSSGGGADGDVIVLTGEDARKYIESLQTPPVGPPGVSSVNTNLEAGSVGATGDDGDGQGDDGGEGDEPQSTQQGSDKSSGGVIYVQRTWETDKSTISTFKTADGKITGYILEPAGPSTTEANKDKRIRAGIYNLYPHVHKSLHAEWGLYNDDLSESRYILLHIGNHPSDTHGCLLPGFTRSINNVWHSGDAIDALNNYIDSYHGNVKIIIYDPQKR